jgi:hypothetical protein
MVICAPLEKAAPANAVGVSTGKNARKILSVGPGATGRDKLTPRGRMPNSRFDLDTFALMGLVTGPAGGAPATASRGADSRMACTTPASLSYLDNAIKNLSSCELCTPNIHPRNRIYSWMHQTTLRLGLGRKYRHFTQVALAICEAELRGSAGNLIYLELTVDGYTLS